MNHILALEFVGACCAAETCAKITECAERILRGLIQLGAAKQNTSAVRWCFVLVTHRGIEPRTP